MPHDEKSTAETSIVPSSGSQLVTKLSQSFAVRGLHDLQILENLQPLASHRRERILVIERDRDVRQVICSILTEFGYQAKAVENYKEATAVLNSNEQFQLV